MHPALAYEITKARLADQQRHAGQAVIGRAARQARRAPAPPPGHPGLARRVLALVAARGRAVPGQPQLLPPCLSPASCASCG